MYRRSFIYFLLISFIVFSCQLSTYAASCKAPSHNSLISALKPTKKRLAIGSVLLLMLFGGAGYIYYEEYLGGEEPEEAPLLEVEEDTEPLPDFEEELELATPPVEAEPSPLEVWHDLYFEDYVPESYKTYESTLLNWSHAPFQNFSSSLQRGRRYSVSFERIVMDTEGIQVPEQYISVLKRYQIPLRRVSESAMDLDLGPYLDGEGGMLNYAFEKFQLSGDPMVIEKHPILHVETDMVIPALWQNFKVRALFWVDETIPAEPLLHWVQLEATEDFDYSRGFVKVAIVGDKLEVLYFQSLIPARELNFMERRFAYNRFEQMGDEIFEWFERLVSR